MRFKYKTNLSNKCHFMTWNKSENKMKTKFGIIYIFCWFSILVWLSIFPFLVFYWQNFVLNLENLHCNYSWFLFLNAENQLYSFINADPEAFSIHRTSLELILVNFHLTDPPLNIKSMENQQIIFSELFLPFIFNLLEAMHWLVFIVQISVSNNLLWMWRWNTSKINCQKKLYL